MSVVSCVRGRGTRVWVLSRHQVFEKKDHSSFEGQAMDSALIKTINRLQDAFTEVQIQNPIDLPQVNSNTNTKTRRRRRALAVGT
jgi:hypothetical protein